MPKTDLTALYQVRKGQTALVDVPELGYLMIEGHGAPDGPEFTAAVQALFAVSYRAHFELRKRLGYAPRVMPLEAQWWVDDPDLTDILAEVARGRASMMDTDRHRWRWQAMVVQPDPLDAATVTGAAERAQARDNLPALDRIRYERWTEGRCVQILHIGPYSAEGPSIVRLHEGIAAAGCRLRGRHHEIYLGDPRRRAAERLRTILRHPIESIPVSRPRQPVA